MTRLGDVRLRGAHLATARRAASVALVAGVAADVGHDVGELLPHRSELEHLLAVIGWPGAESVEVVLDADDAILLERVVNATLILSLDEVEKDAYRALRAPHQSRRTDPAALVAVETLSGLARVLRGDVVSEPVPRSARDEDALVPPALSALADGITLPLWIADGALGFEWVNPAFAAVLGTAPDAAVGTSWRRWCDPADVARIAQVIDAATLEQRPWSVEAGIGPGNGRFTRLLIVAAPRRAPDGELVGWSGICFDVSADLSLGPRIAPMAASLGADAARAQLLLRQFPGVIWTTDTAGRCTSMVGSGLAMLGADACLGAGRPIGELLGAPDAGESACDAHAAALAGSAGFCAHKCCGRDFETHVEPLRDARGAVVGVIGISHDVTDRMARRDENQRLLRQLELAQRIGRIGSWEVDVAAGSSLWSDEAYRLIGHVPGAVEPSFDALIERVIPQDRARVETIYSERMRSGVGFQLDFRLRRQDGKLRTMRVAVEFEHNADGSLRRVLGTIQDVTVPEVVTGQSADLATLLGSRATVSAAERVWAPGP